ncbi:MAG: hypothetical protein A4E49_00398 [Methanosaeta sp. PtaU1.Bin112]|nr:MAG: hypothetical protein A4E49_00398 [Methanosaeta sp. PtaU1.Bin112]
MKDDCRLPVLWGCMSQARPVESQTHDLLYSLFHGLESGKSGSGQWISAGRIPESDRHTYQHSVELWLGHINSNVHRPKPLE